MPRNINVHSITVYETEQVGKSFISSTATMSVFSVDPKAGSPVTMQVLHEACESLGVILKKEEQEEYRKLLAVFDESARELMQMEGKLCCCDRDPCAGR